ncbi:General transcription factor IIH subunit 2 [Trichinella pseudospiralis]|uniref:General transcription factor IIH subunit n=1 Tax=Trichinella pseudospiralis TaxID=6337 RepID=A0A0V1K2Y2_TRIPS|nr:General transcription factor IIH subunit 2 [Trichinella pseudospiralis]
MLHNFDIAYQNKEFIYLQWMERRWSMAVIDGKKHMKRVVLEQDDAGSIQSSVAAITHLAKRKHIIDRVKGVRLGILRHLCILFDCSSVMIEKDLLPSRFISVIKALSLFVDDFFDQNPIGQICIITAKDKKTDKLADFTGSARKLKEFLKTIAEEIPSGEFSLQNSLETANEMLRHMPSHSSREVLVIMGSLNTCDPGDIEESLEILKRNNIRCNFIALSAEVYICKRIAKATNGKYAVIIDEDDLKTLLSVFALPPVATTQLNANLIRMGFPKRIDDAKIMILITQFFSHMKHGEGIGKLTCVGFICPQCNFKYCFVPMECQICGLVLASAPHLARSYQHLYPILPFEEKAIDKHMKKELYCAGCFSAIEVKSYVCPDCRQDFCINCDLLIHETMHSCPGC